MCAEVRDSLVELTSKLIQLPSVNPPGFTVNIIGFIKDWLTSRGFSVEIREYVKDKPNAIVRIGKGKPVLILNGHVDVVPPGDETRWSYPPFSGKVVEGKIFGRGSSDMKGGVAVLMMVFSKLAEKIEKSGAGTLILAATSDEETGGHPGVEALVKDGILRGDAAIIAEPSGSFRYYVGEKGLCQVKLVARGRPAHGSLPILGDNAIMRLVNSLIKARELVDDFNSRIKIPSELVGVIRNSAEAYYEAVGKSLGLRIEDFERVVGTVSFNPGVIRGGSKINMVPDHAELELDMRVPPGVNPNDVVNTLRSGLKDVDLEVLDVSQPNYTPPSERIVSLVHEGISRVLGREPKPIIVTGATDGRYLRYSGIPTVVYGPGELGLAHAYDEYVTIEDLVNTYNVLSYVITKFFNL
ncbi:M20 family metallopeptidase [Vulcanisaeta thermophila]|uniref:M20 family metallopeptidase n=1 Tax=Vulcanisaeta thermophila TaxID=867917 RepID=UPI000853C156|nr:M20 family metallopeptidase [Vulcanisaeta thermophila]